MFRIVNPLGLHARAATHLAQVASGFDAEIFVEKDGQRARPSSIIELLILCGQPGSELSVTARGADAEAALDAIGALIDAGFGEGR